MTFHSPTPALLDARPVLSGQPGTHAALALLHAKALSLVATGPERPSAVGQALVETAVRTFWAHRCPGADLRPPFVDPTRECVPSAALAVADRIGALAATLDLVKAGQVLGRLYTAALPKQQRAQQGIYYTPLVLAEHLLDRATQAAPNWATGRCLDPACGGGALLLPMLRRLISAHRHGDILSVAAAGLRGYDLDPIAAWLAQVLLDAALLPFADGRPLPRLVEVRDALGSDLPELSFDVVVTNPPYGQTSLTREHRTHFARSIHGRANMYSLFLDQAVRLTRTGGAVIALTPATFLGGQYSTRLRTVLAAEMPPLSIDFVSARTGVFEDVLQECVVTTARRGISAGAVLLSEAEVQDGAVSLTAIGTADLPSDPSEPWLLPRQTAHAVYASARHQAPDRLQDWGYRVHTGQVDGSALRSIEDGHTIPLLWAESIDREVGLVWPKVKRGRPARISMEGKEALLVRAPCVLLQRTTAREQERRLVAALLPAEFLAVHPIVAIENHINVLAPLTNTPAVAPEVLAAVLNSAAADGAYRCLSGSTSVSAYELQHLPLPPRAAITELADLVQSAAPRQKIEASCAQLYGIG